MNTYPKRLIEVDLPIKKISAHARREKSIRHGHISTLHIWWARRPLAACRAVICASLWPDPADPLCPQTFRDEAARIIVDFACKAASDALLSRTSAPDTWKRWMEVSSHKYPPLDTKSHASLVELRSALLDFIADFANWDNSTNHDYLATSRDITQAAHEALGGEIGTKPLVVDPFAGGGSIPFEALRVGADAFASDLNPIAVLLNKVSLEYLPEYGTKLSGELRKWGSWVKEQAQAELNEFYPKDEDGAAPISYLWARTVVCEGPNCGAEVPLIGRRIISSGKKKNVALSLVAEEVGKQIDVSLTEGVGVKGLAGTSKGFVATCPRPECGYSTPKKSVQRQLTSQHGGADTSRLLAILTDGPRGRRYRLPIEDDFKALEAAKIAIEKKKDEKIGMMDLIPNEPIPAKNAHRAVGSQLPLYGFRSWGDLFSSRQKLAVTVLQRITREAYAKLTMQDDQQLARAVFLLLAFAVDKQADYLSSLCRWVPGGEFIAGTLAGEKKFPMISDFAEANPISSGSGSWDNHIDWICRFIERESRALSHSGSVHQVSADQPALPADSAAAMITDPPYYDSVPYSDLSDYFYVWLKRTINGIEILPDDDLTPKDCEMTVNHPANLEEKARYEMLLTNAFANGRATTMPNGIGVIVFAHKSTSGWETILEAIIKSGWVVTASWPIDTERSARPNALQTASLASSVHLVCRPRENSDGSLRADDVGDWGDVLKELPQRIHEWMPRLAEEGVVGADAIFACLGPALEIFSRYSSVEKPNGDEITLKEYLEHVWAAVAKEAVSVIFAEHNATGLESDARLTAMWLWTLTASTKNSVEDSVDSEEDEGSEEDSSDTKQAKGAGFSLEFDTARKIAQGLGAKLELLTNVVQVQGDTARLLAVSERTRHLFGKDEAQAPSSQRRKTQVQLSMFEELEVTDESSGWGNKKAPPLGHTTLDQIHQAMILFAAGRGDALKSFLVEEGAGNDARFWQLAQSLSALYPTGTDEKRWVDGVLARKKGLGF